MPNKFIAFIGILTILLVAGFFYNKYRIAPNLQIQSLELTDLNGNRVSLNSFHNKKVFLNFFATWCGPCIQEMPSLSVAQSVLAKDDFQFIFISDEPIERLKAFQEKTDLPFLILHSQQKLSDYKIFTLPTSYLLNQRGEIVFKKVGEADWSNSEIINTLKKSAE